MLILFSIVLVKLKKVDFSRNEIGIYLGAEKYIYLSGVL
jgi:hypothetical protein